MIELELELIEPLGELTRGPGAHSITGMQIDTRRIRLGDLFVAIGQGAGFADEARAKGAAAVLVPSDPHRALAAIAAEVRARSSARIVGITGATGKTTTKDILFALCAPHRRTVASEANFNNELGVPLTLCRIEEDTEVCIVEMGMRGLGQIEWLASFTRPDIAVITNIAPVHLELVGSVENVARAKAEILAALPRGGTAVLPDEPLLEPHLIRDDITIRRFGRALPDAFPVGEQIVHLETSYTAPHQRDNTVAALTVCDVLGVPFPASRLDVEFSPLREEVLELPGDILLVNDCYNANPLSMRAALDHLRALAGDRRTIAVLGGMAELGPGSEAFHEEVGAYAAAAGVGAIVAVGTLATGYARGARGVQTHEVATATEAAVRLKGLLRSGDVVLVKGSRSVGLEALVAELDT